MSQKIRSIIFAILGLSLIIVVHESGHFLMCKLFGVKTPVFSVGFGPVLASYTIGGTAFQLAALPLGGYVAIDPTSLATKTYLQKLIINVAGITFNIIFALLLLIYLMWLTGKHNIVLNGIFATYQLLTRMARAMFGMWRTEQRAQVMGPIGIISSTTQEQGTNPRVFMIWWLALINLNVALFNLLPIPMLDGGHIAMDTIEALYGEPLPPEIVQRINLIFLFLFLAFLFAVSMRDIKRLKAKKES
jgi:regulator of sigma E protease